MSGLLINLAVLRDATPGAVLHYRFVDEGRARDQQYRVAAAREPQTVDDLAYDALRVTACARAARKRPRSGSSKPCRRPSASCSATTMATLLELRLIDYQGGLIHASSDSDIASQPCSPPRRSRCPCWPRRRQASSRSTPTTSPTTWACRAPRACRSRGRRPVEVHPAHQQQPGHADPEHDLRGEGRPMASAVGHRPVRGADQEGQQAARNTTGRRAWRPGPAT